MADFVPRPSLPTHPPTGSSSKPPRRGYHSKYLGLNTQCCVCLYNYSNVEECIRHELDKMHWNHTFGGKRVLQLHEDSVLLRYLETLDNPRVFAVTRNPKSIEKSTLLVDQPLFELAEIGDEFIGDTIDDMYQQMAEEQIDDVEDDDDSSSGNENNANDKRTVFETATPSQNKSQKTNNQTTPPQIQPAPTIPTQSWTRHMHVKLQPYSTTKNEKKRTKQKKMFFFYFLFFIFFIFFLFFY